MTDNDQLLHKIGNLIAQKLEPIKKDMATKSDLEVVEKDLHEVKQTQSEQGSSIARLEQGQEQTNTQVATLATGQAQILTTLKALQAGQEDIREKMATKADIHRLEQKIDKVDKHVKSHETRIENLEDETGLPNPHKN